MKPLISIIIPIYNVEKYLAECVESIRNQTLSNIEIILVDDGSPDSCPKICDDYAAADERIKVIHKENGGLGFARNSGLEIATGEFVAFVDSDDFVENDRFEKMYNLVKKLNADTCIEGYTIYRDGVLEKKVNPCAGQVYESKDVLDLLLPAVLGEDRKGNNYIGMAVWRGLYDKNIIDSNHIRFLSEREFGSEDILFDLDYYLYSNKVVVSDNCGYIYRQNTNSLTHTYNPDKYIKYENLYKKLSSSFCKFENVKEIKLRCQMTFIIDIKVWLQGIVKGAGLKDGLKCIKKACKSEVLKSILKEFPIDEMNLKWKVLCLALKYSLYLPVFVLLLGNSR